MATPADTWVTMRWTEAVQRCREVPLNQRQLGLLGRSVNFSRYLDFDFSVGKRLVGRPNPLSPKGKPRCHFMTTRHIFGQVHFRSWRRTSRQILSLLMFVSIGCSGAVNSKPNQKTTVGELPSMLRQDAEALWLPRYRGKDFDYYREVNLLGLGTERVAIVANWSGEEFGILEVDKNLTQVWIVSPSRFEIFDYEPGILIVHFDADFVERLPKITSSDNKQKR